MPRKLRLEYPGAIYHVINRGNDRAWIFKQESAKQSFEECLFDACEMNGWILHAFVIMENHYHLAVETPQGNLVTGMQWLQSKFANRFNKLKAKRGPLFQGRYKTLLVQPGPCLGEVCHYIHLNPVRAGLLPVAQLATYRFSSYWFLQHPKERPTRLRVDAALAAAGHLKDSSAGRKSYQNYLAWQVKEGILAKKSAHMAMSRGWVIGSEAFKDKLRQDHKVVAKARAWASEGVEELRLRKWRQALRPLLAKVTAKDKLDQRKSAPWKVKIAIQLRAAGVSNAWLAKQLNMGSPFYVSKHVGLAKKVKGKA